MDGGIAVPGSEERVRRGAVLGVVLALLLMIIGAPRAVAADREVVAGTISWGVKASFRNYIKGPIADGSLTVTAPATDDGTVTTFKAATGAWSGNATVKATGAVRFTGHGGLLDVRLGAPELVVDGASARLVVDATDSDGVRHRDLTLASVALAGAVEVSGDQVKITKAPAVLTVAGAALFAYNGSPMYPAGTALDPVSAVFELTPEPTTEPTPTPTPTSTPTSTPTPTPQPTSDGETAVTGGEIDWGFKESFRSYLRGPIAHGSLTPIAPATDNGAVTSFVQATGRWGGSIATQGGVRFFGHGGELDLTLAQLRLLGSGATARLVVDASDAGQQRTGVTLAEVDLTGAVVVVGTRITITDAPVRLSAAGAELFSYNGAPMYPVGTVLDPLNAAFTTVGATPTIPVGTPTPTKTPVTTAEPTPAPSLTPRVRAGALSWGVRASFRSYITGPIAAGSIAVSGGASSNGGSYRFGQATTTAVPPQASGTTTYRGAVRFTGHQGKLDLTFSAPAVRVTSRSSGVLSVHITGTGRVDIATLNLAAADRNAGRGWVSYAGAPARLTSAGARVFSYQGNAFYPAGTAMDPVSFTIGTKAAGGPAGSRQVASATKAWKAPATPPARTGLTVRGELVPGGEVRASAGGFAANEPGIKVVLYSTPVVLATTVTADAAGRATWRGTLPAATAAGEHTLTFQGTVDRGATITVEEASTSPGCQVTAAELGWGFKESFRAYISGSIANGDWSTTGNASYATPEFTWRQGTGSLAEDGTGSIAFTGGVAFTGHSGALDTTVSNPVVQFAGDRASLVLDYSGRTMDAAMAGEDTRQELSGVGFVDLDLAAGVRSVDGGVVTIAKIPTTLTAAGAATFPNYPEGAAFDPITLRYPMAADCAESAATPEATSSSPAAPAAPVATPPTSDNPAGAAWVPWLGGGAIGAVLAGAGTWLIARRRFAGVSS